MLAQRSYQKELLDRDDIPFDDIRQNMRELDTINRRLGGHRINLDAIEKIAGDAKKISILEIGCGDGNNLRQINAWGRKRNMELELTGIDINPACIEFGKSLQQEKNIRLVCADVWIYQPDAPYDIVFSSLLFHHFNDEEVVRLLRWKQAHGALGFFINDLHRHPLAYYSIKILTTVFSKSYLVKNDAPLSVARGFSRHEWKKHLKAAGIEKYSISWRWAFRWLIIARK